MSNKQVKKEDEEEWAEARRTFQLVWEQDTEAKKIAPIMDLRSWGKLEWEDFWECIPVEIKERGFGRQGAGGYCNWMVYWTLFLYTIFHGASLADLKKIVADQEINVSPRSIERWWQGASPKGGVNWEVCRMELQAKVMARDQGTTELTLHRPYSLETVQSAVKDIEEDLPRLRDEHQRVMEALANTSPANIKDYNTLVTAMTKINKEIERRSGVEDYRKFAHVVAKQRLEGGRETDKEESRSAKLGKVYDVSPGAVSELG